MSQSQERQFAVGRDELGERIRTLKRTTTKKEETPMKNLVTSQLQRNLNKELSEQRWALKSPGTKKEDQSEHATPQAEDETKIKSTEGR